MAQRDQVMNANEQPLGVRHLDEPLSKQCPLGIDRVRYEDVDVPEEPQLCAISGRNLRALEHEEWSLNGSPHAPNELDRRETLQRSEPLLRGELPGHLSTGFAPSMSDQGAELMDVSAFSRRDTIE